MWIAQKRAFSARCSRGSKAMKEVLAKTSTSYYQGRFLSSLIAQKYSFLPRCDWRSKNVVRGAYCCANNDFKQTQNLVHTPAYLLFSSLLAQRHPSSSFSLLRKHYFPWRLLLRQWLRVESLPLSKRNFNRKR